MPTDNKGDLDFLHRMVNDIYTLHDEGAVTGGKTAEDLAKQVCQEFLTGEGGLTPDETDRVVSTADRINGIDEDEEE